MALLGPDTHQLDRLGRELKCPICLSLFKDAVSLCCNHNFCKHCILQSMKRNPACPICKVHTTRREVRAAPQMDNLVAIYVSMESAAGLDLMASQFASAGTEPVHATSNKKKGSKSRNTLSDITNSEQSSQIKSKQLLKSPEHPFKGLNPPKKRVQVPQPSSLKGEFGLNKDDIQFTPKSHTSADACGIIAASDATRPSRSEQQNVKKPSQDVPTAAVTQLSKGRQTYRRRTKVSAVPPRCTQANNAVSTNEKQTQKEAATPAETHLPHNRKVRRKERDAKPFNVPLASSPDATNAEMDSNRMAVPARDDTSRRKLDPFFWLRDESSHDTDAVQVTQPTQTQPMIQPNFSDLKDSDDDLSPDSNEEVIKGGGICTADSYDSDDFDWTQQPCSPELKCSPAKSQSSYEDIVIDLQLGAAQPATEGPLLDNQVAVDSTLNKSLLESAREVASVQKALGTVPKGKKELRKSGRVKALSASTRGLVLPVREVRVSRNVTWGWQQGLVGCSSHRQTTSNKPSFNMNLPGETKKTEASANYKRKAEGHNRLPKRKKFSVQGEPDGPKKDFAASQDSGKDKDASGAHRLVCVFCRTSEDSEVTGPMMHYNMNGVPVAGPKSDVQKVHVHRHCAEWAPDVYFLDDVAKNLTAEAARGLKIKCSCCGKKGAALGCCLKHCRRSYHYPCARAFSCKWEEDKFIMLCPEHAGERFPIKRQGRASPRAVHSPSSEHQASVERRARNTLGVDNVGNASTKWACGTASKWVLCGSTLDTTGKEQLAAFARLTGATVTKAWSSSVTHVIAGTDQHGAARRTLKFLMAILEGKWILKSDWLTACTKAGKPVSEEPFEINIDIHGAAGGPKQGRLLAADKAPDLFEAMQFYFMPDFLASYKRDLQALVVAAGGGVLHRKPLVSVEHAGKKCTIVVCNNEAPTSIASKVDNTKLMNKRQAEARELGTLVGANVVPHVWISDSIAFSKVQPFGINPPFI